MATGRIGMPVSGTRAHACAGHECAKFGYHVLRHDHGVPATSPGAGETVIALDADHPASVPLQAGGVLQVVLRHTEPSMGHREWRQRRATKIIGCDLLDGGFAGLSWGADRITTGPIFMHDYWSE